MAKRILTVRKIKEILRLRWALELSERAEERAEYLNAVRAIGKTAFLVNALDEGIEEPSFGGAMIVDGDGNLLAEAPHGSDETVLYEL